MTTRKSETKIWSTYCSWAEKEIKRPKSNLISCNWGLSAELDSPCLIELQSGGPQQLQLKCMLHWCYLEEESVDQEQKRIQSSNVAEELAIYSPLYCNRKSIEVQDKHTWQRIWINFDIIDRNTSNSPNCHNFRLRRSNTSNSCPWLWESQHSSHSHLMT